jgi:3-phosphoshikimate 1-carboxyvinyltransferase
MKVTIEKSNIRGKVTVPSSKSMTLRALMCAALSMGKSEILHPLVSEDTNAAADVLGKIGVGIQKEADLWRVTGGAFRAYAGDLHCGESATTLRFMTALCSLIPGKHRLVGGPSLSKRPIRSLVESLRKLGIDASTEGKTTPPVTVQGGTFKGGLTEIPGNISSQFISALLLIAPFAPREASIKLTTALASKSYILMTLWCLKKFGINVQTEWDRFIVKRQKYQPAKLTVEGDWSSASYFLALGAISQEGVQVDNISTASLQGDRVILDLLRSMGAAVRVAGNSVTVSQGNLKAIRANLSDCVDLLPTVSVLAALAEGVSVFTGIERARIKESNRVSAVKEGLQKVGVSVTEERDRLTITGLKTPKKVRDEDEEKEKDEGESKKELKDETAKSPVVIYSFGDHRIAMAGSIMGAARGAVTIEGAECVAKTFPSFWEDFKKVGGELKTNA